MSILIEKIAFFIVFGNVVYKSLFPHGIRTL